MGVQLKHRELNYENILILVEGESEKTYYQHLINLVNSIPDYKSRWKNFNIRCSKSKENHTDFPTLIEKAKEELKNNKYHKVYVVSDVDNKKKYMDIVNNHAIANIILIPTNPCIEIFFITHYFDMDNGVVQGFLKEATKDNAEIILQNTLNTLKVKIIYNKGNGGGRVAENFITKESMHEDLQKIIENIEASTVEHIPSNFSHDNHFTANIELLQKFQSNIG